MNKIKLKEMKIHYEFLEQVNLRPNKIAITFGEDSITYLELYKKSCKIANMIQKKYENSLIDARSKRIVGIHMNKSIEAVAGMLGILFSGAAYLPIDPSYPSERKKYILKNSKLNFVLNDSKAATITDTNVESIFINNSLEYSEEFNMREEESAYVIYTSGSTGNPKGVLVNHSNVMNTLIWRKKYYNFDANDKVLQLSSISFDSSIEEIFVPLISGAELFMIDDMQKLDVEKLTSIILNESITHFTSVPSLYKEILSELLNSKQPLSCNLRFVTVAGEALTQSVVDKHFSIIPNVELYNGYGPTENSICTTVSKIEEGKEITIGKPISNNKIYIVDENGDICSENTSGELWVSGPGVTQGYINDLEKTSEKFIDNPFDEGYKIYKTGDLVKYSTINPEELLFLGRVDQQIKLRGYRIELEELEKNINLLHDIEQSIVVTAHIANEMELVAFLKFNSMYKDENIDVLRSQLLKILPEYMVPSRFVKTDEFPLTPNGKIDRNSLSKEAQKKFGVEKVTSTNLKSLDSIWKDTLSINVIHDDYSFFQEGGTSLKLMKLFTEIKKEYSLNIGIKEFIKQPYLSFIKKNSYKKENNKMSELQISNTLNKLRLSYPQQMIFFDNSDDWNYIIPTAYSFDKKINFEEIKFKVLKLIEKNEIFRTKFSLSEDSIYQEIIEFEEEKVIDKVFCHYDLNTLRGFEIEAYLNTFNLEEGNLLRISYFTFMDSDLTIVLVNTHHIVSDGISTARLIDEIFNLSLNELECPKSIQYKGIVEWEDNYLSSKKFESDENFWGEIVEDINDFTKIPYDHLKNGEITRIVLRSEKSINLEKISIIAKRHNTTSSNIFLTAFKILLAKRTLEKDILVGMPVSGRNINDFEESFGMFVNTVIHKNNIDFEKTIFELLDDTTMTSFDILDHQNFPYYKVNTLYREKTSDINNLPINAFFNYLTSTKSKVSFNDIQGVNIPLEMGSGKFNFSLNIHEMTPFDVVPEIEYNPNFYDEKTVRNILEELIEIVDLFINEKIIKVKDVSYNSINSNQLLFTDRNTMIEPSNLYQIFESNVYKNLNKRAITFKKQTLSYHEVMNRVNCLSSELARIINKNNEILNTNIGIIMDRSDDLIISILSCLKLGLTYVPIDNNGAVDRTDYILEDSNCKVVLTNNSSNLNFSKIVRQINVNNIENLLNHQPNVNLTSISKKNNVAYILYTSGSTGNPKGVLVEHRSVINLIYGLADAASSNKTKYLFKTPHVFDVSVSEIFSWYFFGEEIVILESDLEKDPKVIVDYIQKYHITHLNLVPTMLDSILNFLQRTELNLSFKNLKYVLSAGEALNKHTCIKFNEIFKTTDLVNLYGPTEATVFTTYCNISKHNTNITSMVSVPIGKPLMNYKLQIIDPRSGRTVPHGGIGELYISGIGTALGYTSKSLTDEKFLIDKNMNRVYKSGDYCRYNIHNEIEYIGRKDDQIKLRGYRIELGEIENQIVQHKLIAEAVVTTDIKTQSLNAYLKTLGELDKSQIVKYLSSLLPSYMIPSKIFVVDEFPLLPSGKVNRKILIEKNVDFELKDSNQLISEEEQGCNNIERDLLSIWKDILECDEISFNDSFKSLGGHSILALELVHKVNTRFNVNLNFSDLLSEEGTVNNHIKLIKNNIENEISKIESIFNKYGDKNVYVFPPILGYGNVYDKISESISPSIKLNCFNVFKDDDIVNKYVDHIVNTSSRNEPIHLLGYCVGGRIAYSTAKELERIGHKVDKIILIDTEKIEKFNAIDEEEIERNISYQRKKGLKSLDLEIVEKQALKNIRTYFELLNSTKDVGSVSSDIYYVSSTSFSEDYYKKWSSSTSGSISNFELSCDHNDVILDKNQEVSNLIYNLLKI